MGRPTFVGIEHLPGDPQRRVLTTAAIAAVLTVGPAAAASATTPPDDPNDVEAIDNPVDENDDDGFDDWGLLGFARPRRLAGLKRRNEPVRTTTPTNDPTGVR